MVSFLKPDDLEPLDAGERLDAVFGHYHIGRDDETRNEIALFFDDGWLPQMDFFECQLWSAIYKSGGRMIGYSSFISETHSDVQLQESLEANIYPARPFDVASNDPLSIALVELTKPAIVAVDAKLRAYTAYVGYGDISWPSDFRSIITAELTYE